MSLHKATNGRLLNQRPPARRRRGTSEGERGQNLVEFALVVPLLALVVFAIFEFGNLLRVQIQLQNAIREGARFTALGGPANYHGSGVTGGGSTGCPSNADVQTVVQDAAAGLPIAITGPTYYSTYPSQTMTCGACTQVTSLPEFRIDGSYTYTPITPIGTLFAWFRGSFGGSVNLSSHSVLYYESC